MKRRTDEEISAPLYAYDADIRAQYGCFAGVDEAGRGPLCLERPPQRAIQQEDEVTDDAPQDDEQ